MDQQRLQDLSLQLAKKLPAVSCVADRGFLVIQLSDKTKLVTLLNYLKDNKDFLCTILTDLFGVDYPERSKRFEVVYNLLSLKRNFRAIIHTGIADSEEIDSVAHIYDCAVWYEREAWDMYGIGFHGAPDLRRILTDYGFEGHPLRKDFPLTGYKEVRYDNEKKKVIYEPVNLTQEFRTFDFLSPWEGTKYILPGDEKAKGNNNA